MSGMPTTLPKPPTDDKRWRIVEATMRRQGYDTHALIEALHSAQQAFGFLDEPTMRYVAASLRVPLSKVYGVATFYHYFTLKPQGKHACVVCLGTACYIKGSGGNPQESVGEIRDQGGRDDTGQQFVPGVRTMHRGLRTRPRGGSGWRCDCQEHCGAIDRDDRKEACQVNPEELAGIAKKQAEKHASYEHVFNVCMESGCVSSRSDAVADALNAEVKKQGTAKKYA